MGVFDGLKFKLEEVVGTVDAADVRQRIADLHQELRQWPGSKAGDEADEIRAKIAELRDTYADAFSHLPGAATVYSGGSIVTMAGSSPEYVEGVSGAVAIAGNATSCVISGGELGQTYLVMNRIVTTGGAKYARVFELLIERRGA